MQDNTLTHTHVETPHATVNLTTSELETKDWVFLHVWANNLGVKVEVLLKRILLAAIAGSHYAEKIPED
jgi:hypothetical protein